MSIYRLKPAFQSLLRPLVRKMFSWGITANAVTLAACGVSVVLGLALFFNPPANRWLYLLVPAWFLLRMALNAIDGMLAREFGQKSGLGAYLNELTDVVSDAALYLPFAALLPQGGFWVGLVILLAALGELAGVLGQTVGASRRYDGPMGKSDRALVFGLLGVWVAMSTALPSWSFWVMPLVALLTACTTINRVRHGLRESSLPSP
jgi:CDP-diacylglycerol---glycerol-3-phosphate 3-phosphatidyltransferase